MLPKVETEAPRLARSHGEQGQMPVSQYKMVTYSWMKISKNCILRVEIKCLAGQATKFKYPDPYTSSPESMMGYSDMDGYRTSSPASIPHLILEFRSVNERSLKFK
ncbi:hypothetical protein U0070_027348 [Myodes glareolus]|uniref:Uncharacterized protein n=1 Tax=Myodes glareolus TaxID=447135 RepID=A0AAW0I2Z8_MYOGA